ncbi:MAG TPA: carboxypeptidase regulatory-like domain-containing protein [Acetivibrio sp.]|uniref:carboxypeptidase regulatory-like domain-containing protein n=1 Tax=Acetivibrio sp. TaxID=1872092 RepID=UPI002BA2BD55|nr:carboxypeptidase regulatory-like domain-containing protein [Acetivibrio sp.]HOM03640.1 carboxypeptidase regulatory-like domain-containing protein [Acetivibrio sp.]
MDIRDKLTAQKESIDNSAARLVKALEKDSIQYNSQDLDQEQKVDVNPVQLNTQNVHVHISPDKNYTLGKITGTTCLKKNSQVAKNALVFLYFGRECGSPVCRTASDLQGNYVFDELPPGFYVISAQLGDKLKYQSQYIKVLPGQSVNHPIILD